MPANDALKRQVAETGQKTDGGKDDAALQKLAGRAGSLFNSRLIRAVVIPFREREPS